MKKILVKYGVLAACALLGLLPAEIQASAEDPSFDLHVLWTGGDGNWSDEPKWVGTGTPDKEDIEYPDSDTKTITIGKDALDASVVTLDSRYHGLSAQLTVQGKTTLNVNENLSVGELISKSNINGKEGVNIFAGIFSFESSK